MSVVCIFFCIVLQAMNCENTSQKTLVEYSVSSSTSVAAHQNATERIQILDDVGIADNNHSREALAQDASEPDSVSLDRF